MLICVDSLDISVPYPAPLPPSSPSQYPSHPHSLLSTPLLCTTPFSPTPPLPPPPSSPLKLFSFFPPYTPSPQKIPPIPPPPTLSTPTLLISSPQPSSPPILLCESSVLSFFYCTFSPFSSSKPPRCLNDHKSGPEEMSSHLEHFPYLPSMRLQRD